MHWICLYPASAFLIEMLSAPFNTQDNAALLLSHPPGVEMTSLLLALFTISWWCVYVSLLALYSRGETSTPIKNRHESNESLSPHKWCRTSIAVTHQGFGGFFNPSLLSEQPHLPSFPAPQFHPVPLVLPMAFADRSWIKDKACQEICCCCPSSSLSLSAVIPAFGALVVQRQVWKVLHDSFELHVEL